MTEKPYPTILVVEDSDEDFAAFKRIMQKTCKLDVPLIRFLDGDEALDFLYRTGTHANDKNFKLPGLIVLDLNLPGTDGREILMEIKQDERLKTIPVVVFTTSSNPKDIQVCYRLGVNSYLLKPTDIEQLKTSMRLFFDYWFKVAVLPRNN